MAKARVIAFYLPQYYPTETNNKWFGEGFTEWTNVGKARRLFHGHYQPKVPADLGYYDLRNPETREKQAILAKNAGIEGFCYYHYWFGDGHLELEKPFEAVIESGKPDLPFCLCWANQSWYSKFWNKDAECEKKLIIEQKYEDEVGIRNHFMYLLKAFQDKRYIKVDGKLLFMIYRPEEYHDVAKFMEIWRKMAKELVGCNFYFVGQATSDDKAKEFLSLGFDGVNIIRKDDYLKTCRYNNFCIKYFNKFKRAIGLAPYHWDYSKIYKFFVQTNGIEKENNIFPTLIPNWDHSPRSGKRGSVFTNSTPENFERHVKEVITVIEDKADEMKIVFLKSWNEWGEGNYIEPDLKYGHGFLNVLKRCLR